MERPAVVTLDDAAAQALPLGTVDRVQLGELVFDRATFAPGWRWSDQHDEDWCLERHHGYLIAGRMRFRMRDGSEIEAAAGDVYLIPPGHDAWTVGDERCVALDLQAAPAQSAR